MREEDKDGVRGETDESGGEGERQRRESQVRQKLGDVSVEMGFARDVDSSHCDLDSRQLVSLFG